MTSPGKFIVIEGTDGSGKTEQFRRLVLRLPQGFPFKTADFPQYDEPSSYFVTEYLNGRYGAANDVSAKKASLFYALDRMDASLKKMDRWLASGQAIIGNRWVGSSMAHQGGKIENKKERIAFFKWLYELEFEICGVPKPDVSIVLHMPAAMAQELVDKKQSRNYISGKARDLHEGDLAHLEHAEKVYLEMAELFPDHFTVVECAPGGKLLSIPEVHEKVWEIARKTLGI